MSWDSYVDNLCQQSNDANGVAHCSKAALLSLDGGAMWYSPNHPHGLQLTPDETKQIALPMKSGDFSSFKAKGIYAEGINY